MAEPRDGQCLTRAPRPRARISAKSAGAAIYDTGDRARIYQNIRRYFQPTRVHLGPIKSLGSHFVPGLRHDDCDPSGLQTATYDSLRAFLAENGLVKDAVVVRL